MCVLRFVSLIYTCVVVYNPSAVRRQIGDRSGSSRAAALLGHRPPHVVCRRRSKVGRFRRRRSLRIGVCARARARVWWLSSAVTDRSSTTTKKSLEKTSKNYGMARSEKRKIYLKKKKVNNNKINERTNTTHVRTYTTPSVEDLYI